jgi:DNA-binding HxlR family transcriptional regulator
MQQTYHEAMGRDELARRESDLLAQATAVVGDRWSLPIVASLLDGPRRYTEIRALLPGIAPNILSARLRSLEEEGLISAERYCKRPPRYEYRLSPDGEGLAAVVRLLAGWASRRTGSDREEVHEACGSALELRWWCPSCGITPGADGDEDSTVV